MYLHTLIYFNLSHNNGYAYLIEILRVIWKLQDTQISITNSFLCLLNILYKIIWYLFTYK